MDATVRASSKIIFVHLNFIALLLCLFDLCNMFFIFFYLVNDAFTYSIFHDFNGFEGHLYKDT